jgi:hypothetical protein
LWSQILRLCRLSKPAAIDLIEDSEGLTIEPAFEFANRDQQSSATTYNTKFVTYVLVEVVPGHPERGGCFVR